MRIHDKKIVDNFTEKTFDKKYFVLYDARMPEPEKSFETKQETWHASRVQRIEFEGGSYKLIVGVRSSVGDLRVVQVFYDATGKKEERTVISHEKDKRDLSLQEQHEIIRVAMGFLNAHPEAGHAA
ncbi:MAG: hypothetical protein AAB463_01185 [Patescibacteria group bacterium]